MTQAWLAAAQALALFVGMLVCLEAGRRIGNRRAEVHGEAAHEGIGTIDAAVFALLGLLLAFTFAGSSSRLDARRQLIVHEANAIGTAYLRLDVLPASDQPELRRLFREYIDARLRAYQKIQDPGAVDAEFANAAQIQGQIWSGSIKATGSDPSFHPARVLLLPALNEMIDVTTSRQIALETYLPSLIYIFLVCVALLSALIAGHAMAKQKGRSLLHMFLYAALVAVTIYVTLDLDNPRSGFIRLDPVDQTLIELRDSIR